MFVWGKNDLNPEQEKAIYNENSILLIACPGSGKTRTITYKIAYELSKLESNKQYIIAITYTNRAADEIKERIEFSEDHVYPAYTLQDILDKLPKRIETEDYEFELYIYYHENGVSVFYDDGDITQLAFFSKPTLLESAYEMLCWCIENGYVKVGKEE